MPWRKNTAVISSPNFYSLLFLVKIGDLINNKETTK
jgi:hypothetical protein